MLLARSEAAGVRARTAHSVAVPVRQGQARTCSLSATSWKGKVTAAGDSGCSLPADMLG